MINDKLSHQLYETIYPVVVKFDNRMAWYAVWANFVEESIKGVPDYIDQELRLKYDGAFYDGLLRFKTEAALTMFLLRFS
jgi:hypothetical protein